MTLTAGIHSGIPAADYHADPCPEPSLSSSLAATIITQSPAHAKVKHPRLTPMNPEDKEETPSLALGSVVHELALHRGGGFSIWEGETWRGKEAAAFWDAAVQAGHTPIKRAEYNRAQAVVDAMYSQLGAMGLGYVMTEGESEAVAIWQDRGHYMRAMFDRWLPERGEIWDIKTTSKSAHPEQIARTIPAMHYDLRSEFYLLGAEKLTGKPSSHALGFCFLFVEVEPPYCVTPCYMDAALKARGKMLATEAIETWCRCMDSGEWPGYVSGTTEIMAPGWVDFEMEESISTSEGELVL